MTVVPGGLQAEAGYTFTRPDAGVETHSLGEVLLRIGLVSRVELRIGVNSYVIERLPDGGEEGFEDILLGTKIGLLEPAPGLAAAPLRPAVAVLAGSSLPTGHEAFSAEEVNPEATLALAWSLSERFAFGSNLNVASLHEDGERYGQISGSGALGISLTERLGAFVEYFGFSRQRPSGSAVHFIDGGVTLLRGEDLQLDVRAGFGLNDEATDYFLGMGLVWRILPPPVTQPDSPRSAPGSKRTPTPAGPPRSNGSDEPRAPGRRSGRRAPPSACLPRSASWRGR